MITYEVEIKGLDEAVERLSRYDKIADRRLREAMKKAVLHIEREVKKPPPVGAPVGVSGRLRNSMASKVTGQPGSVVGKVGSTMSHVYPSVQEFGRKPGKAPPPGALDRWVHIVLKVPPSKVRGVAYRIGQRLKHRKMPGKFFLKRAFQRSKSWVQRYFKNALKQITKDLAGGG